jgi:hypothetical protein
VHRVVYFCKYFSRCNIMFLLLVLQMEPMGILVLAGILSWLWFGLSAWALLVILSWCAIPGERCAILFGYLA